MDMERLGNEDISCDIDRIPPYDPETGQHFWIVTLAYRVTPEHFARLILDHESLVAFVGPGCFYCETVYSPDLATRRCKGDPKGLT